jgi:protein-disulfide isomerase
MALFVRCLVGLVLCAIVNIHAAVAGEVSSAAMEQQLKDMQNQLQELRGEMSDLSGRLQKIEALLRSPPAPKNLTVNVQGAPLLGDTKAKIAIVEFSDYQCPYCRRFHIETFPHLQKDYIDTGKAAFVVKNFPLDFHPQAMDAALTVNCARQQNIKAFWDIQGQLFMQQNRLGKAFYDELIKRYGLNGAEFAKCLADTKQHEAIAKDLDEAQQLGVQGTPTFFIGHLKDGRVVDAVRLVGAQPYRNFVRLLDALDKPAKGGKT